MKLQYASDIHLEFYPKHQQTPGLFKTLITPDPDADMLVIAGDLGYPDEYETIQCLSWCSDMWPEVLWVFGNHEYYNRITSTKTNPTYYTMRNKEDIAKEEIQSLSNVHLLQNQTYTSPSHPEIVFAGTTMWTDVTQDEMETLSVSMNDFHHIYTTPTRRFTGSDWSSFHTEARSFLSTTFDDAYASHQKVVAITHHLPSYSLIQPMYADSPINSGFAAHADDLLTHPALAAWICGHSHGQNTVTVQTRANQRIPVTYNARGYRGELSTRTYNPSKTIVV